MDNVYLVHATSGDSGHLDSERTNWPVMAFRGRDRAQAHANLLQRTYSSARVLGPLLPRFNGDTVGIRRKGEPPNDWVHPFDKDFRANHKYETEYHVTEVWFDGEADL